MHLPGYGIAAADCRQEHDSANKFSMQTAAWVRFAFVRIARMRSRPKSHDVACSEPAMKNSNLYVFSTLMGLVLLSITPLLRAADWSRLKSADVARSEASFLVYEGGVFSFNGFDGNIDIENSVERYDLADNSWEIVANSTTSGSAPSAVTHNGLIIVDDEAWFIGGRIGNSPGRVTDSVAILIWKTTNGVMVQNCHYRLQQEARQWLTNVFMCSAGLTRNRVVTSTLI